MTVIEDEVRAQSQAIEVGQQVIVAGEVVDAFFLLDAFPEKIHAHEAEAAGREHLQLPRFSVGEVDVHADAIKRAGFGQADLAGIKTKEREQQEQGAKHGLVHRSLGAWAARPRIGDVGQQTCAPRSDQQPEARSEKFGLDLHVSVWYSWRMPRGRGAHAPRTIAPGGSQQAHFVPTVWIAYRNLTEIAGNFLPAGRI